MLATHVLRRLRTLALEKAYVLALVLSVLVAPILGSVHQILHSPGTAHSHSSLERLFSHHTDTSDCRLYDQLASGDAATCFPIVALPPVTPFFLLAYFSGEAVARWAALFEARGPPFIR